MLSTEIDAPFQPPDELSNDAAEANIHQSQQIENLIQQRRRLQRERTALALQRIHLTRQIDNIAANSSSTDHNISLNLNFNQSEPQQPLHTSIPLEHLKQQQQLFEALTDFSKAPLDLESIRNDPTNVFLKNQHQKPKDTPEVADSTSDNENNPERHIHQENEYWSVFINENKYSPPNDTRPTSKFALLAFPSNANGGFKQSSLVALVSVIKHVDQNKKSSYKKKGIQDLARETLATMEMKKKEYSYGHLLGNSPLSSHENLVLYNYRPGDIDNPLLDSGLVQRTMLGLPGMIGSIFQYSNNPSIKSELNERFSEQHYELNQAGLSITKIRKTKSILAATSRQMRLEPSSLALSYSYYEKLLLLLAEYLKNKNLDFGGLNMQEITRINGNIASTFNVFASISLLLAAKINEPHPTRIASLLATQLSKNFMLNKKHIYEFEFFVFSTLEFDLFLPKRQFIPHLDRILVF